MLPVLEVTRDAFSSSGHLTQRFATPPIGNSDDGFVYRWLSRLNGVYSLANQTAGLSSEVEHAGCGIFSRFERARLERPRLLNAFVGDVEGFYPRD
jgi:hypothetical protein